MDCVRQKRRRNVRANEEDRISSLPDDLIHHIFSKIDATYIIQTSRISTRWRHTWKSLPHLNFDRRHFSRLTDFSKFVSQFISHRDHTSGISIIDLKCDRGLINPSLVKKIATYAVSHGAQQLIISSAVSGGKSVRQFPLSTFTCRSLQHLSLSSRCLRVSNSPAWNLPNLTTLILQDIPFEFCCNNDGAEAVDLFSKLSNLKNLTLENCLTTGLKVFKIISPSLEHLTISSICWGQKTCQYVVSTPNLVSFNYHDNPPLLRPACHIHVAIDQRRKQYNLTIKLLLYSAWLRNKHTRSYDEVNQLSNAISKLCNRPPTSTLFKQWLSRQLA